MLESDEFGGTKGKLSITPPSSPTSLSSFSSKPIGHNGYYDNPGLSPERYSSTGGEGAFKFLDSRKFGDTEVFTITNGSPDKTNSLSNKSTKSEVSQTLARDSSFSENKYKWTDGGATDVTDGTNTHRKTKTRKSCLILLVIVLVLGILAGVAVILAFTVFKDKGEDAVVSSQPLVSIELDGALSLNETWTAGLDDPSSELYLETERNFTREIDSLMRQSNLSDSYLWTKVISLRPGSIKVKFKMAFTDKYRTKVDSDQTLAETVEQEIKESAPKPQFRFTRQTVRVYPVETPSSSTSTVPMDSSTVPSLTSSSASMESSLTLERTRTITSILDITCESTVLFSNSISTFTLSSVFTTYFSDSLATSISDYSTYSRSVISSSPSSSSSSPPTSASSSPSSFSTSPTLLSPLVSRSSSSSPPSTSLSPSSSLPAPPSSASNVSLSSYTFTSVNTEREHISEMSTVVVKPTLSVINSISVSNEFQSQIAVSPSEDTTPSLSQHTSKPSNTLQVPTLSSHVVSPTSSLTPITENLSTSFSSASETLSTTQPKLSPTLSGLTSANTITIYPTKTFLYTTSISPSETVVPNTLSPTSSLPVSYLSSTAGLTTTTEPSFTTSTLASITPASTTSNSNNNTSERSITTTPSITIGRTNNTISSSEAITTATTTSWLTSNTTIKTTTMYTPASNSTPSSTTTHVTPSTQTVTTPNRTITTPSIEPNTTTEIISSSSAQSSSPATASTRSTTTQDTTSSTTQNTTNTSQATISPKSTTETTTPSTTSTSPKTTSTLPTTASTSTIRSTTSTKPSTATTTLVTITTSTTTTRKTTTKIPTTTSTTSSTTSTRPSTTSTIQSTTTKIPTTIPITPAPTTTITTTVLTSTTEAPDKAPIADAGPDISINLPVNSVTLHGTNSTDDRGIVEYRWTQTTSLRATMVGAKTAELKLSNLQKGEYVFKLTVKDESFQTSSDTARVSVLPELCMEVTVEACRNVGFTKTLFPNLLGHDNETQAIQEFNQQSGSIYNQICQNVALSYLCSLYFPKCNDTTGFLEYPCKSLCYEAVNSCSEYFVSRTDCETWSDTDCIEPPPKPTTTTAVAPTCESTLQESCRSLGFNMTSFPNLLGEADQQEALVTYENYFSPVIAGECHPHVNYFICGSQFPLCMNGRQYKPCKRLCQEVVAHCEDVVYFFFCDYYPEIDCLAPLEPRAECRQDDFTCEKVTKCLDSSKVCDGVNDCDDWSDEMDCQCDKQYEYQCKMGMCIKSFQECDGTSQCPDNSDELHCDGCRNGQVRCPNTDKCIMREWLCDGRSECDDGWDEWHCDRCSRVNFTCQLDQSCIPMSRRCDGQDDCPQGEDEWDCVIQDGDMLQLRHQKLFLPMCAESWDDAYGNYTCEVLLGEGHFLNSTEVVYNGLYYAKLDASGDVPSLLGSMKMSFECMGNRVVHVHCKPRGCGKRVYNGLSTPNIANGEDATHGNWPWHAALYMGNLYFCGGTLINEQFVITAAHCVEKFLGDFRSKMTVKLGVHNRKMSEITQRVVSVQAISSHNMHVWFERNDIALLQLANPVNFTEFIQPVCLPDDNEPLPLHSECWTIGWGKTKWNANYADVLQQLKMTLWDTQKCNSSIAWNGEVYDTFLCAGYYSGIRSICNGDSGGPLLCLDKQRSWRLVGINSHVANFCNMTSRPNIFTNVTYFLPWINERIECKFRCDNGKCLYNSDSVCDRVNDCGDNSDEVNVCNYTATCSFDDKFLCGYNWTGWALGFDNKKAVMIELDGEFHTKSYAPQFDHTVGSLPGYFFYANRKDSKKALLWSPKFSLTGQTCVRFSYYLRGIITDGLSVDMREYYSEGTYTTRQYWRSPIYITGTDAWMTGFFDVTRGDFQIVFKTEELLKVAVDDVKTIPGMCKNVLCDPQREYRCASMDGRDKCIPRESRCNLVIDCENAEDERSCPSQTNSYICTFENGNICGLRQNFGDASDWWLTNGTFVRDESLQNTFEDHTMKSEQGRMFYLNAYNLQSSTAIYMSQFFYLNSTPYCMSLYYIRKADVNFTVHIQSDQGQTEHHSVLPTFYGWTMFQANLPLVEMVNVTYDIKGLNVSFYSYVVIDDITVKPGSCPKYTCAAGYTKCANVDRCFPGRSRCDRIVDCQDESDEASCECRSGEFRCKNGRCIAGNKMCDRTIQCLDGSDEQDCGSYESVTCDFQHPYLCGYEFQSYSKYSWRRWHGRTKTPVTGPQYDHTLENEKGYYVYAEANEGAIGDNATIRSPQFYTGYGRSVEFWYHMFSSSLFDTKPGVLHFILKNIEMDEVTTVWSSNSHDLVDDWRRLCFDLPTGQKLVALFTAVRNETSIYGVDFAIDDVKLNEHKCRESPGSTVSSSIFTTTTTVYASTGAQWMCENQQHSIDSSYRCDGQVDCMDGSDERDCF